MKAENTPMVVLAVIVSILTISGTLLAVSSNFVSHQEFKTYAAQRVESVDKRLDRIENKLDWLILDRTKK